MPTENIAYNLNDVQVSVEEMKLKYYEEKASEEELAILKDMFCITSARLFLKLILRTKPRNNILKIICH